MIFHETELPNVERLLRAAAEKLRANAATLRMSMQTASDAAVKATMEQRAVALEQDEITARSFADRIANQMKAAPTLAEYRAMVKRETCEWCQGTLCDDIHADEHPDGWPVGREAKCLWLSVRCSKCGYDWSLNKLGVPRSPDISKRSAIGVTTE